MPDLTNNEEYGFNIVAPLGLNANLSDSDFGRYKMSLKGALLPMGLMGLAYALGSRDGQGPEAAVGALTGYLSGVQEKMKMAKDEAKEKRQQQLQFMQAVMPMLTPESQAQQIGAMAGMQNVNTRGMVMQNPRWAAQEQANSRMRAAMETESRKFALGMGTYLLKSGDLQGGMQGAEMLRGIDPRYGMIADAVVNMRESEVESEKVFGEVISKFVQDPKKWPELLQRVEMMKPEQQDIFWKNVTGFGKEERSFENQMTLHTTPSAGTAGGGSGGYKSHRVVVSRVIGAVRRGDVISEEDRAYIETEASKIRDDAREQAWKVVNTVLSNPPQYSEKHPQLSAVLDSLNTKTPAQVAEDLADEWYRVRIKNSPLSDVVGDTGEVWGAGDIMQTFGGK